MDPMARIRRELAAGPAETAVLTEADLWSGPGPLVWRAARFEGRPAFYPVYHREDRYSWSPLALLVEAGALEPDAEVLDAAAADDFLYYSGWGSVDRRIRRVGGPLVHAPGSEGALRDPDELAGALAGALRADLAAAEARNPEMAPVVLVGGRDSMNLLLLPWRTPPLVVSAEPNFPLVREFVRRNGLGLEVRRLDDPRDEAVLDREILENACRADLRHYRWGAHLCALARELEGRAVFWKGQVADALTTPYWKTLCHPPRGPVATGQKVYARLDRFVPGALRRRVARSYLEPKLLRTLWIRCAMFQGSHMGLIRGLTGALVLSAYHGPAVVRLWQRVRFEEAVPCDIRPRVGRALLGREVCYPEANPSPPESAFRRGLAHPRHFLPRLEKAGISISGPR